VMLDVNEMAKGERFMAVGDLEVSDDGNCSPTPTTKVGFREYRLTSRTSRRERISPKLSRRSPRWRGARTNRPSYYTVDDAAKRPYRLYRHALGPTRRTTPLVFEEKDEMFRVNVHRSRSLKSSSSSRARTRPTSGVTSRRTAAGTWTLIAPREKAHEYAVEHRGDLFYIRTNRGCRNFRVVTARWRAPGAET